MTRNRALAAGVKATITFAAFYLLARNLEWASVWERVSTLRLPLLVAAVGASLAQIPLVGVRWGAILDCMLGGRGKAPGQGRLQRIVFSAQFVGQVLPFLAGDGLRMLMLREAGVAPAVAVKSTMLDRGFALVALLLVALPGLVFSPILLRTGALRATLLAVTAVGLCAAAAAIVFAPRIARLLGQRGLLGEAGRLLLDMRAIVSTRPYAIRVIGICVLVHAVSVLVFVLLARGMDLPLAWLDAAAIVPALLLATALPVSFAGWGVREVVAASLLGGAHLETEGAVGLSVAFGLAGLLASLPGAALILTLLLASRRRS